MEVVKSENKITKTAVKHIKFSSIALKNYLLSQEAIAIPSTDLRRKISIFFQKIWQNLLNFTL